MSREREQACLAYALGGFGALHLLWYQGTAGQHLAAFILIRALYRYPGDLRP